MDRAGVWWRVLLVVLIVAVILAIADLLVPVASILLITFAGLLFGIFINAIAQLLSKKSGLGYTWAYAAVVALLILIVAAGIFLLGAGIAGHASQLWDQMRSVWQGRLEQVASNEWAQKLLPEDEDLRQMITSGDGIFPQMMTVGQWAMWGFTAAVVIFFVGVYTAYDPSLYESGVVKLLPQHRRGRVHEVLGKVRSTLIRWMIGRIISMSVIGVLTAIGLWLLGVPMAVTLGILAAILTFIPNIGPILAAIPQILLALNVDTNTALYVLIFNIALQGVESYLLTPMVQRYEVSLPPALTILAQLLMAVLFGVIGIMMAAPLTAAIMVVVQLLYIHDRLGDPRPGELAERT
ncbi:MAG: AI-2E family transporter [Candidatus Hydrogenedentes bacterium]|nr:AI-2E family transporter [Candidatus Hydrogenedentota bacterium]